MEKYEAKGVSQASEIRNAYEIAVAENKEYYRTVSKTNRIYGWVNGHHEEANANNAVVVDGELWFKNDKYIAPIEEVEKVEETEEIINEVCEALQEMVEEVDEAEEVDEIDYKALYEEELKGNKVLADQVNELAEELENVKAEFANYKAIVEAFKKL